MSFIYDVGLLITFEIIKKIWKNSDYSCVNRNQRPAKG